MDSDRHGGTVRIKDDRTTKMFIQNKLSAEQVFDLSVKWQQRVRRLEGPTTVLLSACLSQSHRDRTQTHYDNFMHYHQLCGAKRIPMNCDRH